MKLFLILTSILIFSAIGFYSPAYATVCFGLFGAFERGEVFSGTVKSIDIEWYDKPTGDIYDDDVPIIYGLQHALFEAHHFFKGTPFETIDYQTDIPTMDPASAYNSYLEVSKEYLVIGYQHNSTVSGDGCSGGGALEITDSIKNSDIYTKPTVDIVELLTAIYHNGDFPTYYSSDLEYLLDRFEQMSQSPKIQLQNGIAPKKIMCKEDLQLYFKNNYDSSPVCVKTSSIQRLSESGWGHEQFIDNHPDKIIKIKDSEKYIKYRIVDDSTITEAAHNEQDNLVIIKIDTTTSGNLIIELPRTIIDSRADYCPPRLDYTHDDEFFVLIDSEEISYNETKTTDETRTLSIPFSENAREIEIIGTCYV